MDSSLFRATLAAVRRRLVVERHFAGITTVYTSNVGQHLFQQDGA